MLDRYGWPLEVGDRVTVRSDCCDELCLRDASGVISNFDEEFIEVEIMPRFDGNVNIVRVAPVDLEYGTGRAATARRKKSGCSPRRTGVRYVEKAIEIAVQNSVISIQQGDGILAAWLRSCDADES